MFVLSEDLIFPRIELATNDGLLAIGGDLSSERLLLAYKSGIFPWYSEGQPILWWSPDPRFVLFPKDLKVSKSMKKILRNETFKITYCQQFERVIEACASMPRRGQESTWITVEMKKAYLRLFGLGIAKSVEVWKDGELVGGLYGVDLGHVFCGESMFSKVSNASKYGFIKFVEKLKCKNYKLIDCQVFTEHLSSLGAVEIPREEFSKILKSH
ncbi:leucyl/phenylalanyl-tRNA--protein transferase [Aegicerativicinus sediminis]|uniref:leucyl/phenylalanyl-tRNA--protein transferase n=1 Tax=Aegicerativicinus sediminis TaxID=2893202 RepID=UPI001E38F525|nr:leucyl/phenylalanyl-tRNA--protein transferase [Aegicerativicinus sediminis]